MPARERFDGRADLIVAEQPALEGGAGESPVELVDHEPAVRRALALDVERPPPPGLGKRRRASAPIAMRSGSASSPTHFDRRRSLTMRMDITCAIAPSGAISAWIE